MTEEKNNSRISKHITSRNELTNHIIEEKEVTVVGENLKEVKKVFDEKWKEK